MLLYQNKLEIYHSLSLHTSLDLFMWIVQYPDEIARLLLHSSQGDLFCVIDDCIMCVLTTFFSWDRACCLPVSIFQKLCYVFRNISHLIKVIYVSAVELLCNNIVQACDSFISNDQKYFWIQAFSHYFQSPRGVFTE